MDKKEKPIDVSGGTDVERFVQVQTQTETDLRRRVVVLEKQLAAIASHLVPDVLDRLDRLDERMDRASEVVKQMKGGK